MDINAAKNELTQAAELVKFLSTPRQWIIDKGLDPDDETVARTFESFLQEAHRGLDNASKSLANKPMNVTTQDAKGIGFGCCNW